MPRLAIIFSLLFVTPAWAEIVLYCQDELATGIFKEKGNWKTGTFKLERYTLKFDEQKMTLSGFTRLMKCERPYTSFSDLFYCRDHAGDTLFHFDKNSLRYALHDMSPGSWPLNRNDTDGIFYGTCQKF